MRLSNAASWIRLSPPPRRASLLRSRLFLRLTLPPIRVAVAWCVRTGKANHPSRAGGKVYLRGRDAFLEGRHGFGGGGERSGIYPYLSRRCCGRARHSRRIGG